MNLFNKPPEQVPLSPESRKKIFTDALIFRHRPEVGRVIFISAPLRGSDLASNWLGRIGSSLVRAPSTLLSAGNDALKVTTYKSGDLKLGPDAEAANIAFSSEIERFGQIKSPP